MRAVIRSWVALFVVALWGAALSCGGNNSAVDAAIDDAAIDDAPSDTGGACVLDQSLIDGCAL